MRLEPWSEEDFGLLRAMNAPELMEHLGGPETEEQLAARQARYERLGADPDRAGCMFRIVLLPEEVAAGAIGFWEHAEEASAASVYETGWTVLPGFQGRGVATAATLAVVERARAEGRFHHLHAYPSTENAPSNAVCRKAGFTLLTEREFEYPPGHRMRCNDWRLELTPPGA
ncbi:GCN5 family acetyltransferase [Streptomyces showdoensis]|uniref:GCN5 family acetyltransferase n=1 Tax=Streptomyces showdoensis TaxID=68268 RepID=A0A2P2GIU9_STREW|nr:GCN5 family acetyltransferase [Streptomyces showdoensis]